MSTRSIFALTGSLLAVALIMASGCDKPEPPLEVAAPSDARITSPDNKAEPVEAVKKPKFYYSPFVLEVQDQDAVFKKISFKDVGVGELTHAERATLYETMAESLSYELSLAPDLEMPAQVAYDLEITDPKNHLACGSNHLYVDVWRSKSPERWGFSLWSGCGEQDNFAWKEVTYMPRETDDMIEEVKPLTRGIVDAIKVAEEQGCYQKTC